MPLDVGGCLLRDGSRRRRMSDGHHHPDPFVEPPLDAAEAEQEVADIVDRDDRLPSGKQKRHEGDVAGHVVDVGVQAPQRARVR